MIEGDEDQNFKALLGAFGSHSNVERRARAERRAAMRPDDKRRKKEVRNTPLNTRVRKSVFDLAKALCEAEGLSQADLIEMLVEKAAKARGLK